MRSIFLFSVPKSGTRDIGTQCSGERELGGWNIALLEHTLLQILLIVIQCGVTTYALIKVYGEGTIRAELCYIVCQN